MQHMQICSLMICTIRSKNTNFNFEDDDFEIYENLVNIEKDVVYLFKEFSSFIQTMRETFPRGITFVQIWKLLKLTLHA